MALVSGFDFRLTAKAGVTDDGSGNVTGWTDQVSGTREITVPTGQSSPTLGADLNETSIISFGGTDGGATLQVADGNGQRQAGGGGGQATLTYAVIRAPLSNSNNYFIDAASANNRNATYLDVSAIVARNGIDGLNADATGFENEWIVITVVHARDAADSSKVYINGTLINSGTASSSSGTGVTLGARADFFGEGEFDVVEIVEYYDVVEHTQTEVDQNVSHLQGEWGLGSSSFTGAVSIGHTLGLSPSGSASASAGVTNAQTMGMSDQGGATTLASLEQAISLALQTSGAISFEGNITISVTYGQGSSATAQTSAELSGAENVTLFHAYTMSTSAQSSASGATSIDLTYDADAGGQASVNVDSEIDIGFDQSAEGVVGVTNFNAAVSLGALTYQTSITGTAQTVASATQSIQYALDSIAAAAVSSNTSIAYINDISVSATVITVDVTLADGRTLTIKMQNRTYSIDSENRTLTIDP